MWRTWGSSRDRQGNPIPFTMANEMLNIDEKYAREMVAHALEDDPNECCGILAGRGGKIMSLYRIANKEASPFRYAMDSNEHYRANKDMGDNEWETFAFYHSHTHSPAYPSPTDIRLATWGGTSIWPGVYYILISLPALFDKETPLIRAFHIEDGTVTEEDLTIGSPE
jgi:proteasome lid subunit RPN8/RPN11